MNIGAHNGKKERIIADRIYAYCYNFRGVELDLALCDMGTKLEPQTPSFGQGTRGPQINFKNSPLKPSTSPGPFTSFKTIRSEDELEIQKSSYASKRQVFCQQQVDVQGKTAHAIGPLFSYLCLPKRDVEGAVPPNASRAPVAAKTRVMAP